MTLRETFKSFFMHAFDYKGVASRSEFFSVVIAFTILFMFIGVFLVPLSFGVAHFEHWLSIGEIIVTVLLFIPATTLLFRRFNDAGIAKIWTILLIVVPLALNAPILPENISELVANSLNLLVLGLAFLPSKRVVQSHSLD